MSSTSLFDEQITERLDRLLALTGRRCYVIGSLSGEFPDLGHHLPGEMGGIWAAPIKLADGFWFGLSDRRDEPRTAWMHGPTCKRFRMQPGRAEREFLLDAGGVPIEAVQRVMVPEHEPGVLASVTLRNKSGVTANLTLNWLVRWDIQGAWWSNWPDRPDEAEFMDGWGGVVAWDGGRQEWSGAMLSELTPNAHEIGRDMWGPEQPGSLHGEEGMKRGGILPNPEELQGAGISSRLDYDLALPPGESLTIRFVLAGSMGGATPARHKAADMLARYEELWLAKTAAMERLITDASSIETPDASMDRAYSLQNVCLDLLTMEAPGVAWGAVAGLPSFAWFFGCDTYYSVSGLLVSGQPESAIATLRLLANYARRQGGRVPHEITPTGTLFNPGNTIETPQFVTSIEHAYRWTGDRAFLEEMYGLCKEAIFDYVLGECDPDGTYLPDGPGLLELSSAGRGKKLDVAAALHQGLSSLAYMAAAVGDPQTARKCEQVRVRVHEAINEHFWMAERGEYVWRIEQDLSVSPEEPAHSYVMMEMGVLDGSDPLEAARIQSLFEKVEGPEHTGPGGVLHPGTSDFTMPIQNAIVALAEFQYGRPDRGLWYLQRMSELCDHWMPWAIPEFATMMGSYKPCFVQLWSSAAYNWLMVQGWFRLLPDPDRGVVLVRPQLPETWREARVKNLSLWGRRYDLSLRREAGGIEFGVVPLDGVGDHPFRVETPQSTPVHFT